MDEEEIALLEEQLATAHADIERLGGQLGEARERATVLEGEAAALREETATQRQTLSEREETLASQAGEIEALRTEVTTAEGRAVQATLRARDLLLAAEPDLPADLVAGDSIEALDESVARARATVAQVREHLEQQARELRVSPGAPARGGPDLTGLSAAEKIRLGLQQT